MTEFLYDSAFDKEKYDLYINRIRCEDRDARNYENMLSFLYDYVKKPDRIEDYEGILSEYEHWNNMLIEKCFYHLPHDIPYVKARRAYQTVICLLAGDYAQGEAQLRKIGEAFDSDLLPPKVVMTGAGISRLFLLYNYAKVYQYRGMEEDLARLKETWPHAFTVYDDGSHEGHDAFYKDQMEDHAREIFYPVFSRIYKIPGGDREFFVYYEEGESIPIPAIVKEPITSGLAKQAW